MSDSVCMKTWFRQHWSLLLILSVLALFCTKTLFNVPLTIMALIALYRLCKQGNTTNRRAVALLGTLFLCLWLPMLFSFFDAVNHTHAAKTVFPYLRYFLSGVFIVQEINTAERVKKLLIGIFMITTFWWADALIQYILGYNLFGQPYIPEKGLTGMYYPKVRLPHMLAVLAPIYIELIRRQSKRFIWLWLTLPPYLMVLLLGGKRTAWLMLLVALTAYIAYLVYSKREHIKKALLGIALFAGVIVIISITSDGLQYHLNKTAGLFSTDIESIDKATSRRLSLWQIGQKSVAENWLNGVGPRGFRYVDTVYADDDNFWVQGELDGQTHPHLFILEILVETGLIGLAGYLLFFFLLCRAAWARKDTLAILPWLITVMVATFPLNAHLAFYGSYWSSVVWWFIPVAIAALCYDDGNA